MSSLVKKCSACGGPLMDKRALELAEHDLVLQARLFWAQSGWTPKEARKLLKEVADKHLQARDAEVAMLADRDGGLE